MAMGNDLEPDWTKLAFEWAKIAVQKGRELGEKHRREAEEAAKRKK